MLLVQLAALLVLPSCWAIDQFSQLRAKTAAATPLKLDDSSYHALTSGARDYASVVLLTARGVNFGCQVCREVEPDWNAIAKSWLRNDKDGSSRVIFGTLDFVDGKNTFQSVPTSSTPSCTDSC